MVNNHNNNFSFSTVFENNWESVCVFYIYKFIVYPGRNITKSGFSSAELSSFKDIGSASVFFCRFTHNCCKI